MRILRMGSIGPAVELLQLALNRAGFGELNRDGIFSSATDGALRRFQSVHGLTPDGVAGRDTHRALLPWYTGYIMHRVKSGDTLWTIAQMHGSSVDAIETANPGIVPERLSAGEYVTVPLPFPVVPVDISWSSALVGYCVRGLAARYPFISAGDIGKSVMGRPLWRLSLGTGENRVLYNASHHANEWICTPVLMKFAEELCQAYVTDGTLFDQRAADILSYADIHLIPAANIRGVDLNLQYPAGWEQARENKYALGIRSPAPADYVGSAPLTAPESRAMYDYTLALAPALTLALHTQGEVIYWRYLDYEPPQSRRIGEIFSEASGYTLEETPFASGFAGYKDWFIESFDRPGYTIEAGLGTNPLPTYQFPDIYERCLGILVYGALVT